MHFYGPLLKQAWQTTAEWMAQYSLGTRAIFAIVFGLVSLGTLRKIFFPENSHRTLGRFGSIIAELVFGPVVVISALFLISLLYYAPSELMQHVATNAAQQARNDEATLVDRESTHFNACRDTYDGLLKSLADPNERQFDEIAEWRYLMNDAKEKANSGTGSIEAARFYRVRLGDAVNQYRREHPNACDLKN